MKLVSGKPKPPYAWHQNSYLQKKPKAQSWIPSIFFSACVQQGGNINDDSQASRFEFLSINNSIRKLVCSSSTNKIREVEHGI